MHNFRKSAVGASLLMVQPLLLNLMSLPVTAYIIAILGPEDYGHWAVALTLLTTVTILTNIGLRSFFVRAIAQEPESAPQALAEQLGLRALLAIGAGTLAVTASYLLDYPRLVVECTAILSLGLMFTTAGAAVSDLLQAREQLPALASINLVSGLLLNIGSLAAMWLNVGPLGLACAYVVGPITTAFLSLVLVERRMFPVRVHWGLRAHWALLKQSKNLGLQQLIWAIGSQIENLLVPKLVGLTTYGYFAAGTLLPRRMDVVSDALSTAFYPAIAKAHRRSVEEGHIVVKRFVLLVLGLTVPAALMLFLIADPLARILFPKNPDICREVLQITVWWVPLLGLANGMGYALNATGQEMTEVRLSIISTVTSLLLSVVLIVTWGLVGACIALVARGAIGVLMRLPYFVRSLAWQRSPVVPVDVAPGKL
jgi:O-antigen/teichoic acid export membrane protein